MDVTFYILVVCAVALGTFMGIMAARWVIGNES